MNKHFIAFLLGLGIDKKVIDELYGHKDDDTVDLTDMLEAFRAKQLTIYENDAALVSKIEDSAKGKLLTMIERKIKSDFGLTTEQIKDKKIEEIISIAKKVSSDGKDKPIQELEQKLMDANTKLKEFEEVTLPAERDKAANHIKSFEKDNKFKSLFKPEEYRVPVDAAYSSIKAALDPKYDFDIDDAGELVAYQKGTQLRAKNNDNTGVLSVSDLIKDQSQVYKFIQESNADGDGKGATVATGANGKPIKVDDPNKIDNKLKIPHFDAANKKLDEIKKETEAAKTTK